jgi:hypothetical protein
MLLNFVANMVTMVAPKFVKNVSICCAISFREREIILEQRITKQQRNKMDDTIAAAIVSCRRSQERWLPWCSHNGSPWSSHHGSHCFWACFLKKVIFCRLQRMTILVFLVNSLYQFDIWTGRNEK